MKKVTIFGGGTGMSTLLKGLKEFPLDITSVVSVCDDGKSTGKLRKEFNIPAMGDIRRVMISLSETEPLMEKLLNYRFSSNSELNEHTVGNLLLTAGTQITGNSKILTIHPIKLTIRPKMLIFRPKIKTIRPKMLSIAF